LAARDDELVANQHSFRLANERLHVLAGRMGSDNPVVAFLCECGDAACLGRVEMRLAEYEKIHLEPNLYSIIRDHALAENEELVERRDGFDVVRKPEPERP
jgi:hypothetical protein